LRAVIFLIINERPERQLKNAAALFFGGETLLAADVLAFSARAWYNNR
jgi:hypothetical protein